MLSKLPQHPTLVSPVLNNQKSYNFRILLLRDFQLKKYRIPRGAEEVTVMLSP